MKKEASPLDILASYGTISVDTSDFEIVETFKGSVVHDATMNPSTVVKAAQSGQYRYLLKEAIDNVTKDLGTISIKEEEKIDLIAERLTVLFGSKLLNILNGIVSTEVNPEYAFDVEKTIQHAKKIVQMYEQLNIPRKRIYIKIPATWEGCLAAKKLESENIQCNMTLVFSLCQAIAVSEAKATIMSPFVGRITDWHKKNNPDFSSCKIEPGIQRVKEIYEYCKHFGYTTLIMGASFRTFHHITELTGLDKLTLTPNLIQEVMLSETQLPRKLSVDQCRELNLEKIDMTEKTFRWMLNQDCMATEKLAEGIREFYKAYTTLKFFIKSQL